MRALIMIIMLAGTISLTANAQQTNKKTDTVTIHTSAVCEMCKQTIESALYKVKGVISASLDVESKNVTIVFRPAKTNVDALRTAISRTGYDADDITADPTAYDGLNPCCKKGAH